MQPIIAGLTPETVNETLAVIIAAVTAIGTAITAILAVVKKLKALRAELGDTTTALDVVTDVIEQSDNGAPKSIVSAIKRRVEATAEENDAEKNHAAKPIGVIIAQSARRAEARSRL